VDALFYDAMSAFASLLAELVLVEEERSVNFVVVGREVVRNLGNSELFIADLNTSPPSFFLYFLRYSGFSGQNGWIVAQAQPNALHVSFPTLSQGLLLHSKILLKKNRSRVKTSHHQLHGSSSDSIIKDLIRFFS
jgi:hypothetical protein